MMSRTGSTVWESLQVLKIQTTLGRGVRPVCRLSNSASACRGQVKKNGP